MKYLKKITLETWLMLIAVIIKTIIDINVHYKDSYLTFNKWFMICVYILAVLIVIGDLCTKKIMTIYGIVSEDHEVECLDVTYDSFKELYNDEPTEYDKSFFYLDLYRVYNIPITKHMRKLSNYDKLLKIKLNDYTIIRVKKSKIPVIKKS